MCGRWHQDIANYIFVYCYIGMLLRRYVDTSMCWYFDTLISGGIGIVFLCFKTYWYVNVSMHYYIIVFIYWCSDVLLYRYIDISRYWYVDMLVCFVEILIHILMWGDIWILFLCFMDILVGWCIDILLYYCMHILLSWYVVVSVYWHIEMLVYWYVDVMWHKCLDMFGVLT